MRIFESKLSGPDWSAVRNENVDEYMECFITRVNELFCECFLLKSKLISKRQVLNTWMSPHLKK